MGLELALALFGLILLLEAVRSHRLQLHALGRRRQLPEPERYPSVSVIRPIRGLDAGAEQNIAAALDHGYPGEVQTLFVFDDESEPALPLVRQAIAARAAAGQPVDAGVVLAGSPPPARTGKLNAMIAGLRQARGELVAFADSDIRPERQALRALVQTLLSSPKAGSAFAPVVSSEAPATAGDAGYALLLNGLYGPAANLVSSQQQDEMPFIMGQFMVFRREALSAIGGLESADGQLVDDMYLGSRISQAGLSNRVSPQAVPVIQRELPNLEFLRVYLRWITFSRSGLPGREFKLISWMRGVVFWLGLVLGVGASVAGLPTAALTGWLAVMVVALSVNQLHRAYGGAPLRGLHRLVGFALLLIAPAIYLSIFLRRGVSWRGRHYQLDANSRLAALPSPGQ